MAAMVSAECHPGVNDDQAGSARQPCEEDFESEKDDQRGQIETHTADSNRRKQRSDRAENGFSDPIKDHLQCRNRTRPRRGKPAHDNSSEQAQKVDLRDVMDQDPHGSGSEIFVERAEQKCSFFLRDFDPNRKNEVHRRTLKTLH